MEKGTPPTEVLLGRIHGNVTLTLQSLGVGIIDHSNHQTKIGDDKYNISVFFQITWVKVNLLKILDLGGYKTQLSASN